MLGKLLAEEGTTTPGQAVVVLFTPALLPLFWIKFGFCNNGKLSNLFGIDQLKLKGTTFTPEKAASAAAVSTMNATTLL